MGILRYRFNQRNELQQLSHYRDQLQTGWLGLNCQKKQQFFSLTSDHGQPRIISLTGGPLPAKWLHCEADHLIQPVVKNSWSFTPISLT